MHAANISYIIKNNNYVHKDMYNSVYKLLKKRELPPQ